ncbi:uncharacterized protein A4U43_C04F26650 [Asparagus officinalis]|uniref:Uncharacterized protein n=1 Tax=Asparagus officinalis TaxID=4686 RepID=A0A5P1F4E6_ASPOF|nr:uncharacterized protein A4U43_C04F26650 [Asparagus officinalis]
MSGERNRQRRAIEEARRQGLSVEGGRGTCAEVADAGSAARGETGWAELSGRTIGARGGEWREGSDKISPREKKRRRELVRRGGRWRSLVGDVDWL